MKEQTEHKQTTNVNNTLSLLLKSEFPGYYEQMLSIIGYDFIIPRNK